MSDFDYNGVELDVVTIDEMDMEACYSADGTEYLYTKFTLGITAFLNPDATSYASGGTKIPDKLPNETLEAVRHTLMQPRRPLRCSLLNATILESPLSGLEMDCNNGPTPLSLRVQRFDGNRTYVVFYRIETYLRECPGGSFASGTLISNRFDQVETINDQHMATRITQGQAIFRTDFLQNEDKVADDFRRLCIPFIPRGFRRVSINVTATSKRNALTYQVVDQEQFFDLGETDARKGGSGVIKVDAKYAVSTLTSPEGVATPGSLAQVTIQVWGNRYSSNWKMTQWAYRLAQTKLPLNKGPAVGFVRHAAIQQSMTDRFVALTISMQLTPKKVNKILILNDEALRVDDSFADHQGVNPAPPFDRGTRGTAGTALMTKALFEACTGDAGILGYGPASDGQGEPTDNYAPPKVTVSASDELPNVANRFSSSSTQHPYTDYAVFIRHRRSQKKLQAPVSVEGKPCLFLRTSNPVSMREIHWSAERVNEHPEIPSTKSGDANVVLLDEEIEPHAPVMAPDGESLVYRISGVYRYGLREHKGVGDKLPMGALPWMDVPFEQSQILETDYKRGIIGPASGFDEENPTPDGGQET